MTGPMPRLPGSASVDPLNNRIEGTWGLPHAADVGTPPREEQNINTTLRLITALRRVVPGPKVAELAERETAPGDFPGARESTLDEDRAMAEALLEPTHRRLDKLTALVELFMQAQEEHQRRLVPITHVVVLPVTAANGDAYRVDTKGRPYNALLAATAVTISLHVPGLPVFTLTLQPGWNQTNLPAGTEIQTTAANPVAVLFRASFENLSGAL